MTIINIIFPRVDPHSASSAFPTATLASSWHVLIQVHWKWPTACTILNSTIRNWYVKCFPFIRLKKN